MYIRRTSDRVADRVHVAAATRISADRSERVANTLDHARERSDHDCADWIWYFVFRGSAPRECAFARRSGVYLYRVYPEVGRSALAWGEIIPEGCRRVRPCHARVRR